MGLGNIERKIRSDSAYQKKGSRIINRKIRYDD